MDCKFCRKLSVLLTQRIRGTKFTYSQLLMVSLGDQYCLIPLLMIWVMRQHDLSASLRMIPGLRRGEVVHWRPRLPHGGTLFKTEKWGDRNFKLSLIQGNANFCIWDGIIPCNRGLLPGG